MMEGAKAWQKINADKIKEAGIVQDSIHQTASELGVKSDKLAEGKLEKETDPSMMAQNGNKINLKDLLMTPDRASLPFLSAVQDSRDEFLSLDPVTQEQIRRGIPVAAGLPGSTEAGILPEVVVKGNRSKSKRLPIDIVPMERTGIPLYNIAPQQFSGEMPDIEMAFQQPQAQAQDEPQGKGPRKPIDWKN